MSMPRYTHMESTETISQSPLRRASSSAASDLPEAVTPTRATTLTRRSPAGDGDVNAVPGTRRHLPQPSGQVMGMASRHLDDGQ